MLLSGAEFGHLASPSPLVGEGTRLTTTDAFLVRG
jgi:hypothetical protein